MGASELRLPVRPLSAASDPRPSLFPVPAHDEKERAKALALALVHLVCVWLVAWSGLDAAGTGRAFDRVLAPS
jgi:hypothetical protein